MGFDEEWSVQKKVDTRDELLVNILDVIACIKERQDALRRTTRHVFRRVAKCIDIDGGILEYVQVISLSYQQFCGCTFEYLCLGNRSELDTCSYKHFCLEWPILWPPSILTFSSGTLYINGTIEKSVCITKEYCAVLICNLQNTFCFDSHMLQ